MVDVLVSPSVPVPSGHRTHHEMIPRKTVFCRGCELVQTPKDALSVLRKVTGPRALPMRIDTWPGWYSLRPWHRRIENQPFKDRARLATRWGAWRNANAEDRLGGISEMAQQFRRSQASPTSNALRSEVLQSDDELGESAILRDRFHPRNSWRTNTALPWPVGGTARNRRAGRLALASP